MNISIEESLLAAIDARAAADGVSRSRFLADAARLKIAAGGR